MSDSLETPQPSSSASHSNRAINRITHPITQPDQFVRGTLEAHTPQPSPLPPEYYYDPLSNVSPSLPSSFAGVQTSSYSQAQHVSFSREYRNPTSDPSVLYPGVNYIHQQQLGIPRIRGTTNPPGYTGHHVDPDHPQSPSAPIAGPSTMLDYYHCDSNYGYQDTLISVYTGFAPSRPVHQPMRLYYPQQQRALLPHQLGIHTQLAQIRPELQPQFPGSIFQPWHGVGSFDPRIPSQWNQRITYLPSMIQSLEASPLVQQIIPGVLPTPDGRQRYSEQHEHPLQLPHQGVRHLFTHTPSQQPVSAVQSLASPSVIERNQPVIDPIQHTTLLPPVHNVVTPAATQSQINSFSTSQQSQVSVSLREQASYPSSSKKRRLNSPTCATSSHQQSSHDSQTQLELFSHTPQQSTVHPGGTLVHLQQHDLVSTTDEHSQLPEYNHTNIDLEIESASHDSQSRSSSNEAALEMETQSHQPISSSLSTAAVSPITEQQSETSEPSDKNDVLSRRISDLQNVYEAVYKVQSKWFNFGLALGVSYSDLESVMKKNQNSPHPVQDSLRDTLHKRLEMKPLTWMDVTKALRSPPVEHNELATEIEEQCYRYPPSTPAVTAPSNTPLKNYADYLKGKYLKMTVLPDDWPPPLDRQDHFTNLALIERKKYTELPGARKMESIECDYAYGNVDNIVEKKKPIELKQIFDPLPGESASENRFTILMDGAPGVGKTTISRKICIDWAQGKLLSNYYLVPILVPLRELVIRSTSSQNFTIEDLIPTEDLVLKGKVVEHVRRTAGDGVMFIFDGFDELSSDQRTRHSLFLDIMKGNKLHNCSVLVTSRTYASGPLETIARITHHVEVLGFKKKQIEECIMKNIAEEDKAKELIEMLNGRMDILSLCYIPLNCRIVLYVYKLQYSLPDTLTKLYEVFILYTLKHYADKISTSFHLDAEEILLAGDFESLPDVIIKQLDYLSELAFNGMTEDKLVFRHVELKNSKDVLSLGLINMIEAIINTGELKYYQFMHLTVQEFMAAQYLVSERKNSEKLEFLESNLLNDRFRMTLLFLSGLAQLDFLPPEKAFPRDGVFDFNKRHKRRINRSKFLFLAQLLYESRSSTCTWLLLCFVSRSLNMSSYSLSQFDCIALAHFLSTTPEDYIWDEIDLRKCDLLTDHFTILLSKRHIKTKIPVLSMTKCLHFSDIETKLNSKYPGTKKLYQTIINIFPLPLLVPVISKSSSLKILTLPREIKRTDCKFVQNFASAVVSSRSLQNIFIFFNPNRFPLFSSSEKVRKCLSQSEQVFLLSAEGLVCNLDTFPLRVCPKSFSMFLKWQSNGFREVILSQHPEALQGCADCGIDEETAWKRFCEQLLSFDSILEKLVLPKFETCCKSVQSFTNAIIYSSSLSEIFIPDLYSEKVLLSAKDLVCNLDTFPSKVCPISFSMLMRWRSIGFREVNLGHHPEALQGCAECGIDEETAWKTFCEQLLGFNSILEKLLIPKIDKKITCKAVQKLAQALANSFNKEFQAINISSGLNTLKFMQGLACNLPLKICPKSFSMLLDRPTNGFRTVRLARHSEALQNCIDCGIIAWKSWHEVLLKSHGLLNTLSLEQIQLGGEGSVVLVELLKQSQITDLNISECDLTDNVIDEIACNLISLKKLNISLNSGITSKGYIKFFKHLRQNMSLISLTIKFLSINGDNENEATTRAMCNMIKDNTVMTELIIGSSLLNNIELLAKVLVQNNTLEVFYTKFEEELKKLKDLVTMFGHGKTPKWMHSANNQHKESIIQ